MKNSLKILSLFLAASVPSTIAAEFAGLVVPAPFDTLHVFAAYVTTISLLTMVSDYAKPATSPVLREPLAAKPGRCPVRPADKATHPLAA